MSCRDLSSSLGLALDFDFFLFGELTGHARFSGLLSRRMVGMMWYDAVDLGSMGIKLLKRPGTSSETCTSARAVA